MHLNYYEFLSKNKMTNNLSACSLLENVSVSIQSIGCKQTIIEPIHTIVTAKIGTNKQHAWRIRDKRQTTE